VHRRLGETVERPALVVRPGQAEAVEHLDLGVVDVDATVAAALPTRLRLEGRAKLNVQLAGGEPLLALRAPAEEVALDQLAIGPLVRVGAVEQYDRPLWGLRPQ